jgi:hypothetical protein
MMYQIWQLYDKKANVAEKPFVAHSREEVIRSVLSNLDNMEWPAARWPEDFCLYCLWSFDDDEYHDDVSLEIGELAALHRARSEQKQEGGT